MSGYVFVLIKCFELEYDHELSQKVSWKIWCLYCLLVNNDCNVILYFYMETNDHIFEKDAQH